MTAKGWAPGVATNAAGRPRQMAGQPFNKRTAPPPAAGIGRNDYAGNFADFLAAAPTDKPWCFWYGAVEPHRGYEYGSGVAKGGKRLADVDRVPGYWPDNDVVRNDMLDYAFEVEHFDRHLLRMVDSLEQRDELDNTLIVVTSDHGMPFPRAKGQEYDFSNRVPLAIMWNRGLNRPGRTVDDYVSFIDLAPTFIELAGLTWAQTGMAPATGRSLTEIFRSAQGGRVMAARDHLLIGKERNDIGRPQDWGYPIRGIVKNEQLYLRNFEPARWPACNPETGYLNCDGGATRPKFSTRAGNPTDPHWALCFGKRASEEFYDLATDPACLTNLADDARLQGSKEKLQQQLFDELKALGDPRMIGEGQVFEQYTYANPVQRTFYERFMRGEKIEAGWVNKSDFEKAPLD